jgi:hypothetical protein
MRCYEVLFALPSPPFPFLVSFRGPTTRKVIAFRSRVRPLEVRFGSEFVCLIRYLVS